MGQLARSAGDPPLLLCHARDADKELMRTWRDLGATLLACNISAGQLDPADMLRQLAHHGLTRVFCEGGSALAASLIEADLVDELADFTGGLAIGAEGLPSIGALGLGRLAEARRFALASSDTLGSDVLTIWRRVRDEPVGLPRPPGAAT